MGRVQYMSLPPCTQVEQAAPEVAARNRLERQPAPSLPLTGRPRDRSLAAWSGRLEADNSAAQKIIEKRDRQRLVLLCIGTVESGLHRGGASHDCTLGDPHAMMITTRDDLFLPLAEAISEPTASKGIRGARASGRLKRGGTSQHCRGRGAVRIEQRCQAGLQRIGGG